MSHGAARMESQTPAIQWPTVLTGSEDRQHAYVALTRGTDESAGRRHGRQARCQGHTHHHVVGHQRRPRFRGSSRRIEIMECEQVKYPCKEHPGLDVLISLPKPPPR